MTADGLKRVLCVFETVWDRKQLEACRGAWEGRVELGFPEPVDADTAAEFDVLQFVERAAGGEFGRVDAVMSSSDYPGVAASAAIAARSGLPGPSPESVLRAAHKWYSRLVQREAVPEATPRFELIDPLVSAPPLGLDFPCFVKPVKGSFSMFARRIESRRALEALLGSAQVREFAEHYVRIFNRLLGAFTDFAIDGRHFIAEELIRGELVTVEGFVWRGRVELLGIVDSIVHPETGSFVRFDYPSALPEPVHKRMADIAERTVLALGLESTLFNIEMMWDRSADRIAIIEVNPRICGQFGDLYHKVDGTSGYEVALALCTGERPAVRRRRGSFAVACSVPLRVFEPTRLERTPGSADIAAAEALFPGTLVWSECRAGDVLADFGFEDGASSRYAVLNLGAPDRAALLERASAVEARLGFALAPVRG